MIILYDLDGTLLNFEKRVFDVLGIPAEKQKEIIASWPKGEYELEKQLGYDSNTFWRLIDKFGEDFWYGMEPYDNLPELLALAESFTSDIFFCTSPSSNPVSSSGKVRWIKDKMPKKYRRRFVITPHKYLLSQVGTVLIDDSDKKINEFNAMDGGLGIVYPQRYNSAYEFENIQLEYVKQKLEEYIAWL